MKSKLWILILSSLVLSSGCVTTHDECVWTEPLYYDSNDVVDWLSAHDRSLLAKVTAHNEKRAEFCR